MDRFDRNSRQRLLEKTVEHRIAEADRARDRARLLGYVEHGSPERRLLLFVVLIVLLTVIVLAIAFGVAPPLAEDSRLAHEPAWGTATDEISRVRPPAWWPAEP